MDLYELLQLYRTHRPQLQDSTAEVYRYGLRSFERVLGRTPDISDLTEGTILRFLGRRLKEAAGWTCKRELGSLCLLWKFAWKKKLTANDPRDADIPPVRLRQEPAISLTVEQVRNILDSTRFERGRMKESGILKAVWWRLLVLVLWSSGGRIGAILSIRQGDLDRQNGWVHLSASAAKTGFGQYFQLPPELIAELPETDPVFLWPYGRRQLFVAFRRIVIRAGLPPGREYRFHAMRRTFATIVSANSSIEVARQALGHTTQSMTAKYIDPRQSGPPAHRFMPRIVG